MTKPSGEGVNTFHRKILGAMVGNAIEFYDFSLFGALADVIGDLFFPTSSPTIQLLQSLSVFGAAFICRPVGGLLAGRIGDLYGRKQALEFSILLMLVPSFFMGCLLTYQDIQWGSTFLVILIRLSQGVAAGGEFSTSLVFAVEATAGKDSAFWTACVSSGASIGSLTGISIVAIIRRSLTPAALRAWGWRIPFLLTPLFGLIGLHLRRSLKDNEEVMAHKNDDRKVFRDVFKFCWREMVMQVFLLASWGPMYYLCFVWISYYLANIVTMTAGDPWTLNCCMLFFHITLMPIFGIIVDHFGLRLGNKMLAYKYALQICAATSFTMAFPAFYLLASNHLGLVLAGYFCFVAPLSLFGAAMPPFVINRFPVQLRVTGLGLSFNVAQATFTSSTTIICTLLVAHSTSPAYYVMSMAALTAGALACGLRCAGVDTPRTTPEERWLQDAGEGHQLIPVALNTPATASAKSNV